VNYGFEYARALELIAQGQQEDRPLADRISAYEQAIEVLKNIDANSTDEQNPTDLAAQIKSAEHELENLRLQEFFP
jgi:hypothetical protein